jgi:hypothetical protein
MGGGGGGSIDVGALNDVRAATNEAGNAGTGGPASSSAAAGGADATGGAGAEPSAFPSGIVGIEVARGAANSSKVPTEEKRLLLSVEARRGPPTRARVTCRSVPGGSA